MSPGFKAGRQVSLSSFLLPRSHTPLTAVSSQLRHTAYDVTLWRTAANVFLKLAPLGATAVDATSHSHDAPQDGSRLWGRLSEALSKFLLGPVAAGVQGSRAAPAAAVTPPQQNRQDPSIPVIPFLGGGKAAVDVTKSRKIGRLFSREVPGAESPPAPPEPAPCTATADEGRAVEDAELELKVLDCLTDEILISCGSAEQADIDALLHIIEEGISRPAKYQIAVSAKHSNFSLVCIRKMYVLCSRGSSEHDVRNHVARCALPRFLKRCHHVICTFSEESQYTPLGGPTRRPAKAGGAYLHSRGARDHDPISGRRRFNPARRRAHDGLRPFHAGPPRRRAPRQGADTSPISLRRALLIDHMP